MGFIKLFSTNSYEYFKSFIFGTSPEDHAFLWRDCDFSTHYVKDLFQSFFGPITRDTMPSTVSPILSINKEEAGLKKNGNEMNKKLKIDPSIFFYIKLI